MIRLTENKVAIQAVFDPDVTPGGIIIPDVAKERCDQGVVKYIGPKVKDLKIGDYVLFGGYDGTTVRLEGEGVLILMRETAVKCIVEHDPVTVEGLYFKSKGASIDLYRKIKFLTDTGIAQRIMGEIAKYIEDSYFSATSESAINLISQAYKEHAVKYVNKYTEREENPNDDYVEE